MISVRVRFRTAFTWESFYRNNTKFLVSPRSYKPFWSVVDYRHAFATRPSQLGHSSPTGTKPRTSDPLHDTGTECSHLNLIPVREPE